ncbi:response regulator [Acanthopleuribacter pedis]|uniref:histidine kinase n=1 Tax=Acanthopleuribacter pedis TaxID=442870 RepID=A0A8J7QLB8_9BACT|nr:response regulator [Acanthopleuribacter pedis]MBO1320363.1 response regulator [Acanthopleuribacter pedis]
MSNLPELLTIAAQQSSHGLIVLDESLSVVFWNDWMAKSSGIAAEHCLGKSLNDIFADPIAPRLLHALEDAVTRGQSAVLSPAFTPSPLPLAHPSHHVLRMKQKVAITAFRSEEVHYCLLDVTDVSLAANREIKLREQTELLNRTLNKLSHILDGVSEAVLSTSVDGYVVQTANKVAESMFGMPVQSLVGAALGELVADLPEHQAAKTVVLETETRYGCGENQKSGFLSITVNSQDKFDVLTWVIKDISALKNTEQTLIEARKMAEDASNQKSRFLANMSHEIRTPLNGILGMSDLLWATTLDGEQQEYTEMIRKSGETLLAIINDILDFSKIESDKIDFQIVDFSLTDWLEDVIGLVRPQAHFKGLEIGYHLDFPRGARVKGDPLRIRQVLFNLLSNGIKFTNRGGVFVRLSIDIGLDERAWMYVEVEDTGIGIDKSRQDELFQPFVQIDGSSTRRFGGTGLGLAISKRLIELMGGEVGLNSALDEGSRFFFKIPVESLQFTQIARPPIATEGLHVLVLSGHPFAARHLENMLAGWDLKATLLSSLDALDAAEKGALPDRFQLVFLDCDERNIEVLAKLRERPSFQDTRFVLLRQVALAQTASQEGTGDPNVVFVHKPLKSSVLTPLLTGIQTPAGSKPKRAKSPSGSRYVEVHVLVVEDNTVNQKVISRILTKAGFHVSIAENGEVALSMLADQGFDLVLMDCQMPIMDGYEATEKIREMFRESSIRVPIIALTASAMAGDRERCLRAGMDDYLTKPVKQEALFKMINEWIDPMLRNADGGTSEP